MNRLLLPPQGLESGEVVVRGESLSYLRDVLRLRPGAPVEVFDGAGAVFPATLLRYEGDGAVLELGEREERPFLGVRVTLYQGLPKADKLELVVQKAVELGAVRLVPVVTERSIVKLDPKKAEERVVRWQRIADEAARQCGRADTMQIAPVVTLRELLSQPAPDGERRLVLDEEERLRRLRDTMASRTHSWGVFVGPEGGLARHEVQSLAGAGFLPVTLGPRILRTETVGLAVLSILQHALGDLG